MATLVMYQPFAENSMGGTPASDDSDIDWLSDTIKATLHTSTYTPSTAHETFSQVTNELTTASGYTAGGQALGTKTVVRASGVATYSCAAFSWTASGGTLTFQYCAIWNDTTTSPADALIGYIDCGAQAITTGNTFTITPGANGLFTVTVT